jgi:hypothetical protein
LYPNFWGGRTALFARADFRAGLVAVSAIGSTPDISVCRLCGDKTE